MKGVKQVIISFLVFVCCSSLIPSGKEKIKWMTLTEMKMANEKQAKPILFDVYTGWCGWCKVMDKDTYGKSNVADYINEHFYPVKLDAESRDSIEFNHIRYGYNPSLKSNELAVFLLYGQLAYPTTVFLSSPAGTPAPLQGYMSPNELEAPLKYYGTGSAANKSFTEFMQTFSHSW